MTHLLEIVRRLRGSVRSSAFEREMAAELQLHLELEADLLVARGMDRIAADAEARRRFGSVAHVRDECRDSWGLRALDEIRQDVRYALRTLARAPAYAGLVLLTLGLGIGANTAIFSAVHAVLLRSLPYANGESLVEIKQQAPSIGLDNVPFSAPELADYRRESTSLDAIVEYHQMGFNLLDGRSASRVVTGVVSADFFDVIGVKPLLGRTFRAADDSADAPAVLVLSYAYWRDALAGDPKVIGRTFEMNDRVHTVVGVLPPVTAYPEPNDVYMPVSSCPFRSEPHMQMESARTMRMVSAIGRMTRGTTLEQTQRDLAAIAARLAAAHPKIYTPATGYTATAVSVRERLTARARPTLLMLLATTVFVLVLVAANVANLTLARLAGRERELTLRTAIGAGRGRIARQLITENLMLALGGGVFGLGIAALTTGLLVAFAGRFTPRAGEIGMDGTVLLFALGLSIVTGLLCAVIPAMRIRRRETSSGVRGGLITAQVAISFVLLVAAGLMVRSFVKLQAVDAGFDADRVLTAQVDLDWVKYGTMERRRAFFRSFLTTLEQQPDVKHAAWGIKFPLDQSTPFITDVIVEGAGGDHGSVNRGDDHGTVKPRVERHGPTRVIADFRIVSTDYFRTLGMTLVSGRTFTSSDEVKAPPVAIVNLSMARRQLGEIDPQSAIGRRVSLDGGRRWTTVVGVVNDVKQYGLDTDASDEIYVPLEQRGPLSATLLVRTAGDPHELQRVIEGVAQRLDPHQPVSRMQTLEQARRGSLDSPRVTMLLVSLFAVVALIVTAVGIAGVVSFAVSQRTVEIGLRMALGASCASVVGLIVRQGMRPVALGLVCGAAAASVMATPVSRLLYAVRPTDVATYGAVLAMLAGVAALACLAPARRAAAVDPMRALRTE